MTIKTNEAHRHLDGEISFGYSSYDIQSDKEEWFLPPGISREIINIITLLSFKKTVSNTELNAVIDCLAHRYNIDSSFIRIDNNISYVVEKIPDEYDKLVQYNQESIDVNVNDPIFDYIIKDKEQLATYITLDGLLVSWAFDNKNGNHTVGTHADYRRKGYAKKCLDRLIVEYNRLGKKLYHNTTKSNIPSMQLAIKCGMTRYSEGYWIRISPDISNLFYENNRDLFR